MADNLTTPIPDSTDIATKDLGGDLHAPKKVLVDYAGAEVLGQVTASPTANTVLDRLKALLTGIVLAAGTNAIGKLSANSGVDIGDVDVTTLPGEEYEYVAASASNQALGATGGSGDLLNGVLIIPSTTSPGSVVLKDGSTSPDVGITLFAGGADSVSTLHPFFVPLGVRSTAGAWYITTGSAVSCVAVGNFT